MEKLLTSNDVDPRDWKGKDKNLSSNLKYQLSRNLEK